MKFKIRPSNIGGEISIPGSKSHTIRALALALLAEGESMIREPLVSADTLSCYKMIEKFGAKITSEKNFWKVLGMNGEPAVPDDVIDIGNSGTSLYIGLGIASLVDGYTVFTGDSQIRNRPADALIKAISELGGQAFSTKGNNKPPVVIRGKIKGGKTSINAVVSQYLSSLLIAVPLISGETVINVPVLNEKPYAEITLSWLNKLGIEYKNNNFKSFYVKGYQKYRAFDEQIPADFSSATFFLVAAAITGRELTLNGLDFSDSQGDKEVANILKMMGADVSVSGRKTIIKGGRLKGGVFDLNAIPDSLPSLAVAACFADGETRLVNVPQARLKETDRLKAMTIELRKMGGHVDELSDGLIIRKSNLKGAEMSGYADHRIVMALSVAGLMADGETTVDTAEAAGVTFPEFYNLMKSINADITEISDN